VHRYDISNKRTNHRHTTNTRRKKPQENWIIFYVSPSTIRPQPEKAFT
jgi:hypothetical protein